MRLTRDIQSRSERPPWHCRVNSGKAFIVVVYRCNDEGCTVYRCNDLPNLCFTRVDKVPPGGDEPYRGTHSSSACRGTFVGEDSADTILQNAASPKRVKGDSAEVEQHPLPDQIEAVRFANAAKATKRKNAGLKLFKLVPPGAD